MTLSRLEVEALVREDLGTLLEAFVPEPGRDGGGVTFDGVEGGSPDGAPLLSCTFPDGTEHYGLRWTFVGTYGDPRTSNGGIGPTGNSVMISGFTIIEIFEDKTTTAMRYVDWLGAYAQLGLVEMRRPAVLRSDDGGLASPPVLDWPPDPRTTHYPSQLVVASPSARHASAEEGSSDRRTAT
jgi:hypothetical protein